VLKKGKLSMDWKQPDWNREVPQQFWDPSRKLLASIRTYQHLKNKTNIYSKLLLRICVLKHKFWSVVTGAEIDLNCKIAGGLMMPHPNGIVIHPKAVIGPNCLIFQQVTLAGKVTLGFHVDIGAGAKILGPLSVGDNVKVGANAVVIADIPNDDTQVGIPARTVKNV
jgi:serine O-acetyltransferase